MANVPTELAVNIEMLDQENHDAKIENAISIINEQLAILETMSPCFMKLDINVSTAELKPPDMWIEQNQIKLKFTAVDPADTLIEANE
jgi:hypothetical protein